MRSLLSIVVVAGALLGLLIPEAIDAKGGGGGRGSSRSTGKSSSKIKEFSSPTPRASTRSGSSSKATAFKAARYTSKSTTRTYKPAPVKTPRYWASGATRTVTGPIRVHDGDTFYANGRRIRVRGIDTPELGQPRSFAARERLQQLLSSGTVTLQPRAVDKYGRTVATVMVNGQDVAAVLRAEGYAK